MNHPASWAEAVDEAQRLAQTASELDGWVGNLRPSMVAELDEAELERMESLARKLQVLTAQARHIRGDRVRD